MDRGTCVEKNVGSADRALRGALCVALFTAAPLMTRQPYWLVAVGTLSGLLLETAVSAH